MLRTLASVTCGQNLVFRRFLYPSVSHTYELMHLAFPRKRKRKKNQLYYHSIVVEIDAAMKAAHKVSDFHRYKHHSNS